MKERKNVQCASSAGSKRKMIKMDSENEMNRFFAIFSTLLQRVECLHATYKRFCFEF